MEKKDLAREYALARLQGRLSGNEVSFPENNVFTEEDIEAAFEAGAEWADEHLKNRWHTVADEDWPNSDKDYLCYNGIDVRIGWFDTNKKVFYNPYSRYKERMLDVECWAEIPELPKRCVPK